jgi:hypothetical protein
MEAETTYRHLILDDSTDRISGFALWYKDPSAARLFFDFISRYFQSQKHAKIRVEFTREEYTYTLDLSIPLEEMEYSTEISGIVPRYVEQLCETLKEYPYIPILAGYTDNEGNDKFIEKCHFNAGHLYLNGSIVTGVEKRRYPLHLVERVFSQESHERGKRE